MKTDDLFLQEGEEVNTLKEIQRQVGDWAQRQFGANKSHHQDYGEVPLYSLPSLLGMFEELGEISHATVYRHQGRGFSSEAEQKPALEDGAADLLIFLCDWACRENIDLCEVLEKTWERVSKRTQKRWLADKAAEKLIESGTFPSHEANLAEDKTGPKMEQTGAGFAEPPEIPEIGEVAEANHARVESAEDFVDQQLNRDRSDPTSYRKCEVCGKMKVHRNNTTSEICTQCAVEKRRAQSK